MDTLTCRFCRLGQIDYLEAWALQKALAESVAAGDTDILLLLEHPPTYTLGARGGEANLLVPRDVLESQGLAVYNTDRGGNVTFHGPGQLVGYPIFNLRKLSIGIRQYLRCLEEVLIQALEGFGLSSDRCEGYTGVWAGEEKVAAIGVKVTAKRITQHGFALNVNTDLSYFSRIIPCGISDRGVTTLSRLLERAVTPAEAADPIVKAFSSVFAMEMVEVPAPPGMEALMSPEQLRCVNH